MEEEKIKVIKVSEAAFFIEDLFRHSFGHPPPTTPVHYVAFYREDLSTFTAVGYYHVTQCGAYALVGGLCVDTGVYRKLYTGRRSLSSDRERGIGEKLVRAAFADAGENKAFFAYVGNPMSRAIICRVGFVDTKHKYLMARWLTPISEEERERIIAEVATIGPF